MRGAKVTYCNAVKCPHAPSQACTTAHIVYIQIKHMHGFKSKCILDQFVADAP